jgi:hypothetical protein
MNNFIFLEHFSEEERTPELCLEAVKQDGWALKFVPIHLMTEEICLIAIKEDCESLFFIPEKFQTNEICKIAIEEDFYYYKYIKNPTQEIINLYNLLTL